MMPQRVSPRVSQNRRLQQLAFPMFDNKGLSHDSQ